MFRLILFVLLTVSPALQTAVAGDDDTSRVLGSVRIAAGSHSGDATTVNGSVELGASSVVKRAETVKTELMNAGVAEHQIKTVSLGKEGVLCIDMSDVCRQMNRRVEIILADVNGKVAQR